MPLGVPSKHKDEDSDGVETVIVSTVASSTDLPSATESTAHYSTAPVVNASTTAHSPPVATFTGAAAPLKQGSWFVGALGAMLLGAL